MYVETERDLSWLLICQLAVVARCYHRVQGIRRTIRPGHPDGFALFTGTLFAPTQDRDAPGQGFTHHPGDTVAIRSEHLGALVNRTGVTEELPPWTYGIRDLFAYLQSPAAAGTPQQAGRNS